MKDILRSLPLRYFPRKWGYRCIARLPNLIIKVVLRLSGMVFCLGQADSSFYFLINVPSPSLILATP